MIKDSSQLLQELQATDQQDTEHNAYFEQATSVEGIKIAKSNKK